MFPMGSTQKAIASSISLIVLTYNQRDKTLRCLKSLRATTDPPFHVVLWDNGSQDGTVGAVSRAFPEVLIHHHPSNLGVAGGRNAAAELAIKIFRPSHLLFLDNDIILEPDCVKALHKPFEADDTLGQTQPKLLFMDERRRLNDGGGCEINFWLGRTVPIGCGEIDHGQYNRPRKCVACGGAMMVRTDIFQQLRGFDLTFGPFGPEDLDFSLRLSKAGYHALYVPEAVAYHEVSHTFGGEYDEEYARNKSRHWYAFLRRHASPIQQLGFFFLGAPYLAVRVMLREGRKGNLGAIRGIVCGFYDFLKSSRNV
jgi:GT2 family glycosyltransferase